MKVEAGNRIKLGIFVSVALALFIIVIYFIGDGKHMFTKTFHVSGTFKDLGGLQVGNNVCFTGISVGTVSKVEIVTDSTVRVDMVIEKHVQKFMKQDAAATIGSEGLMGNKVINILAGSPNLPMIKDGGSVRSITPVSIDDIMASLSVSAKNAEHITGDIAVLTGSIKDGHGTIGKLFMDTTLAISLDKTIVNVQHAAGGFSENMTALKHNVLLRGYYKKKEKAAEKEKKEEDKK